MTVVILGATKGIGRAVARAMAARGDRLFLLGRGADDVQRSASDLDIRAGRSVVAGTAECDLARPETFVPALDAAAAALATAGATEGLALASVFASRLPGCTLLSVPVQTLTDTWGPGAVPALACGTTATALLVHATRTLTRASAHAAPYEPR